jgi:RNA polymerase sigma factor (sigma-70 family)
VDAEEHALSPPAEGVQRETKDEGATMIARHLQGEPRAFEELVQAYGATVYGYLARAGVRREAADDLFQETFLRVHTAAARYDPAHPFRVWLYTIAHNLVRSHHRKQRVRRVFLGWLSRKSRQDPHAEFQDLDPADPAPGPDEEIQARSRAAWLEQALAKLPDGSRRALLLTQTEGLSLEDAAKVLAVPVATVKTWVRRGRMQLAEALARSEKENQL